MQYISTFVYALIALFSFHSLAANAQFQLRRDPHDLSTRSLAAEPPSPIALRQHHEARAVLDVCAYVDAKVLGLIDLQVCLCLSALPAALEANVELKSLVKLLGVDAVTKILTKIILAAPSKKQCSCPDNGRLVCAPNDPCNFECEPPYVRQGSQCVCQAPYMLCNGKCGSYPHGCGSAVPNPYVNARSEPVRRTRNRQVL